MRSRILPSKRVKSGNYWPASEMPSRWRFAGGEIVVRNGMLTGYAPHHALRRLLARRATKAQTIVPILGSLARSVAPLYSCADTR